MKDSDIKNIPDWIYRDDAIEAYKIFEVDLTANTHQYKLGDTTTITRSYPYYYKTANIFEYESLTPIGDIAFDRIGWAAVYSPICVPFNHPKNKYIIAKVKLWGIVEPYYEIPEICRGRGVWSKYDHDGIVYSTYEHGNNTCNRGANKPVQYYIATNIDVVEIIDNPQEFLMNSVVDVANKDPNFLKLICDHYDEIGVLEDPWFMKTFKDEIEYSALGDCVIPIEIFMNKDTCPDLDNPAVREIFPARLATVKSPDEYAKFARQIMSEDELKKVLKGITYYLTSVDKVKSILNAFPEVQQMHNLYTCRMESFDCQVTPAAPIFETIGIEHFENFWVRIPSWLTRLPEDLDFIDRYADKLDWNRMAMCYRYITPQFYEKYKDRLPTEVLLGNCQLCSHFIHYLRTKGIINADNLVTAAANLKYFSASTIMQEYPSLLISDDNASVFHSMANNNKTITPEFINKYWFRFNQREWDRLCRDNLVDEGTAIKFAHCISWDAMSEFADMTPEFISHNWYRLNPSLLARNPFVFGTSIMERDEVKANILAEPYLALRADLFKFGVISDSLYKLLKTNADKIIHNLFTIYILIHTFTDETCIKTFEEDFGDLFFWRA